MNNLELKGGVKIGMARANMPFATLNVTVNKLELNASIIGTLVFQPKDIISIEPYGIFAGQGIKINHTVSGYNKKVIFWT